MKQKLESYLTKKLNPEAFDNHDDIEVTNPNLYEDEEQKEVFAPD